MNSILVILLTLGTWGLGVILAVLAVKLPLYLRVMLRLFFIPALMLFIYYYSMLFLAGLSGSDIPRKALTAYSKGFLFLASYCWTDLLLAKISERAPLIFSIIGPIIIWAALRLVFEFQL